MRTVVATIEGTTPYSQSRAHFTDKLEKEAADDYEKRTWRERMHVNDDGYVQIPPMAFKNCLSEAAKFLNMQIKGKGKSTYTKHFVSGVMVTEPMVLPSRKEDCLPEWLFVPADGVRGSGKRVLKCFPHLRQWGGAVEVHVLDDVITNEVFERVMTEAGKFIGIGRFRPANNGFYGRFVVKRFDWSA
jgi:hypothetical protein